MQAIIIHARRYLFNGKKGKEKKRKWKKVVRYFNFVSN